MMRRQKAHGACMLEMRNAKFCLENLKGRCHFEEIGIDGRIVLKCTLENRVWWLVGL
jgi:hypothetical protein